MGGVNCFAARNAEMERKNWKVIAATCAFSAAAFVVPTMAEASWPGYSVNEISGQQGLPNAALSVNSYNKVVGAANYTSNQQDFTGMFGGVNINSSYYNLPSNWNSMQLNQLNSNGNSVGTVWINEHPVGVYIPANGPYQNMQAGLQYTYQSIGNGVNHAGIAVGSYNQEAEKGPVTHMFRWDPVSKSRTGDWVNLIPGGINENGMMVAQNIYPTNPLKLCEMAFVAANGTSIYKSAPGYYTYLQPNSISTYGGVTVVGDMNSYIQNDSNTTANGFAYSKSTDIWQILPGVGNQYFETHGLGVDVWGTKAAGYTVDQNGVQTATVWELVNGNWVPTPVSQLVGNDPNWRFQQATSISPEGAISGIALRRRGIRWVPTSYVLVPSSLLGVVVREGGIYGGLTVNANVHMSAVDPFTLDLGLATNSSQVHVPGGIRMPAGLSDASFAMVTDGVDSRTPVNITVNLGGFSATKNLLLLPAVMQSLTLRKGDDGEVGLINFLGQAGPSGIPVSLSTSNDGVRVPAMVKLTPGQSDISFRANVSKNVRPGTTVTIYANQGSTQLSQSFVVG